ncbi:hypothetical protein PLEOSDRAFT_1114260 [Pleurotus ostreatus PC15]|uniref:F-box domain-containing protein n=1 Tax=Pleurotus ostreatus (strain PC15) TaxID=1137138 RepID=A0A067N7T5_PLEO1|nr:hypothetical protein PLEOSDRAFT_1114260 [Pleurotus ostreatus PC15]
MDDTGVGGADQALISTKNALPVELIHQIIADLAQSEDNTSPIIGACALVCRAWAAICRAHIFRQITISYRDFTPRLSFLYFTAPHLGKYILELVIRGQGSRRSSHTFPEWTAYCFGLLNNLRSLRFHHVTGEWSQISTPLVQGITTLLSAPRLQKLHISGWAFGNDTRTLLFLLSLCSTSLQDLMLQNVDVIEPGIEVDGLSAISMEALSSLRLECVSHPGLTETLIKCPNLKSMLVKTNDMRERYPLWISSMVKELNLIVFPWSGIPKFGNTARISVLSIDMATPTRLSEFQEWLEACISNLPHPHLLAELRMQLQYKPEGREYPEVAEYTALSSYLSQLRDRMPLGRISATMQMIVRGAIKEVDDTDQVREVTKLREGFAPILGPGVDIRLVVQHVGRLIPGYMDCRV